MDQNVKQLRQEIARLTRTIPDSVNSKHLTERIADLKSNAVTSISMTKAALAALDRIVEIEMPGKRHGRSRRAELIRVALAEYARSHGHQYEAELIEEAS